MGERLRAVGLALYAAAVVAVVVLGVFAVTGRLEAYVLGTPFVEVPPPCEHGVVGADPYFRDAPEPLCVAPPVVPLSRIGLPGAVAPLVTAEP